MGLVSLKFSWRRVTGARPGGRGAEGRTDLARKAAHHGRVWGVEWMLRTRKAGQRSFGTLRRAAKREDTDESLLEKSPAAALQRETGLQSGSEKVRETSFAVITHKQLKV